LKIPFSGFLFSGIIVITRENKKGKRKKALLKNGTQK
jgi:hypothetical protein